MEFEVDDPVGTFDKLGRQASVHYADDSCREWGAGDKAKRAALEVFDAHPGAQARMREVGKGFLWSLERERPINE